MHSPERTVGIVQPGARRERGGNRTTALRWAKRLRELGQRCFIEGEWSGRGCDLLVALHARRSLPSIRRFRAAHPDAPLVVAGTGTDLYVDLAGGGAAAAEAREGFESAARVVVLQENALDVLPPAARERALVLHQTLPRCTEQRAPSAEAFEVCVLASLRPVKDPLLAARAARRVPADSRVRVLHLGGTLDPGLGAEVEREMAANPRYRFLGELHRRAALELVARCRLLVSSSLQEGGANVVTEALALGVPVLSTRIPGATGLVGDDYPGLFPAGDVGALAELLTRAEREPGFLAELDAHRRARVWIADPARERESWRRLLAELSPTPREVRES